MCTVSFAHPFFMSAGVHFCYVRANQVFKCQPPDMIMSLVYLPRVEVTAGASDY